MKRDRQLILGLALIAIGLRGMNTIPGISMGGMMGGPMMMDRDDMKAMMNRMMRGQLPPGIALKDLPDPKSEVARLLNHYCTQCHNLPGPGMHTEQEWPYIVDRMNQRMQMMGGNGMMGMMRVGIEAPNENELKAIVEYLQAHAQQPLDVLRYSDLDTPAGLAFQGACSRCHVLPDPRQHTAAEWPAVVERMTRNMQAMGKSVPEGGGACQHRDVFAESRQIVQFAL